MKLNLKYNALKVDEIEQIKKLPIENCIADTSVSSLVLFIQKGLIDDNEQWGVSKTVAMDVLDKYLAENDKEDLIMDIMEALINGGFLSREVDINKVREQKKKLSEKVREKLED